MSTSRNFEVAAQGEGFVDIAPRPEVTLSATSLLEAIERIRTELGFKGDFEASTNMYLRTRWMSSFGIRLHSAGKAVADALRDMDLFPVLEAEKPRIFEVRFIHENLAHVDPHLVLTVGDLVEFTNRLSTHFNTERARFALRNGQFVFDAGAGLINFNNQMIEYCQPLYRHVSVISGSIQDGRAWLELRGPVELFTAEKLSSFGDFVITPERAWKGVQPARLKVAIDIGSVDSIANMRRFYDEATEIALQLGVHPLRDFTITHGEDMTTTLKTSPISSR